MVTIIHYMAVALCSTQETDGKIELINIMPIDCSSPSNEIDNALH